MRRSTLWLVTAAFAGGVVGGALVQTSGRALPEPAQAELTVADAPGTVRARRVIIENEEGETLAHLSGIGLTFTDPATGAGAELEMGDGEIVTPRLVLRGPTPEEPEDRYGMQLELSRETPHLMLSKGLQHIQCSVSDGMSLVRLSDANGDPRMYLRVDADGGSSVVLEEADGQGSTSLIRQADGTGRIAISDGQAVHYATVEMDHRGEARIKLQGADGDWVAP